MTITYANIVEKLLIQARDTMRADSTLCTLLGTTTVLSKNLIFSGRPVNQKQGFTNPRVVCEIPIHDLSKYGDNPDGYNTDVIQFTVNGWIDETPIATSFGVMERIRNLFDNVEFNISEGGMGTFNAVKAEMINDPDKPATMQCRVLINTNILTKG